MRQVSAGGEAWRVQRDMRPHFGLGDATVADIVRIEWPSGTVQELTEVAANQILTVIEPPRLRVEQGGTFSWPTTSIRPKVGMNILERSLPRRYQKSMRGLFMCLP